jgi:outer membrane protein assembly factor BamA
MKRKSVTQITNTFFNCYEGSYSEDGNSIAFVVQKGDYHELAVIHKSDYLNKFIPGEIWHANVTHRMNAPRLASGLIDSSKTWKVKRFYSSLNWLKPRTILPYALNSSFTGTRWGAVFTSSDLLLRNSYNLELSTSNQRLWYNATYRYSGFYPGFEVSAFDEPLDNLYVLNTNNNQIYYGEEKQGFSFGIPIPITLKQNVRYSSLYIRPEIKTFRARPITTSGKYFTGNNWKGRFSSNLLISYKTGLQQDIQAAQPNTGTIIFAEGERDFTNHLFGGKRRALRSGIYTYLSPLRRFNQSLRLGLLVQTQTSAHIFNTSDLISSGFKDNFLSGLNNVASFSTRYAMPIINPDNGGFLLPLYLQQIYGVIFTNTATDLDNSSFNSIINHSRTVYGIGLHFVTGLSNIRIDLGFGLAYEPTRNKINGIIGIL